MTRHWITALILASAAPTAWGYDYQANAGALSYSFFNLSPNTYTLTPYGGGANPLNPPTAPSALRLRPKAGAMPTAPSASSTP